MNYDCKYGVYSSKTSDGFVFETLRTNRTARYTYAAEAILVSLSDNNSVRENGMIINRFESTTFALQINDADSFYPYLMDWIVGSISLEDLHVVNGIWAQS